jgi:hypothetical protein
MLQSVNNLQHRRFAVTREDMNIFIKIHLDKLHVSNFRA